MSSDINLRQSFRRRVLWVEFYVDQITINFGFHYSPHDDEILAALLILIYADREWIEKNSFYDQASQSYCILLGIGHGSFDEHSGWRIDGETGTYAWVQAKPGQCCATLVASSLNLPSRARAPLVNHIEAILKFTDHNDRFGQSYSRDFRSDISHVIKFMYRLPGKRTPQGQCDVIDWAFQGLSQCLASGHSIQNFTINEIARAMLTSPASKLFRAYDWTYSPQDWLEIGQEAVDYRQQQFDQAREFVEELRAADVGLGDPDERNTLTSYDYDGYPLTAIRGLTDNPEFSAAARAAGLNTVFQINTKEHPISPHGWQIFNDKFRGIKRQKNTGARPFDMSPLVYANRIAEQTATGYVNFDDPAWLTTASQAWPDESGFLFRSAINPQNQSEFVISAYMVGSLTMAPDEFRPSPLCPGSIWHEIVISHHISQGVY